MVLELRLSLVYFGGSFALFMKVITYAPNIPSVEVGASERGWD